MKKIFLILAIAGSVIACNNDDNGTQEPSKDTIPETTDTINNNSSDTVSPDNSPNMMTEPGKDKTIKITDTLNRRPHQ